jgi:hypothetical protein
MRAFLLVSLLLVGLAACHRADEDNIQARYLNQSDRLQQRYNELSAEADNDVAEQAAPVDAETANLLNQMNNVGSGNGTAALNHQ